jgi:hypothetical protein
VGERLSDQVEVARAGKNPRDTVDVEVVRASRHLELPTSGGELSVE